MSKNTSLDIIPNVIQMEQYLNRAQSILVYFIKDMENQKEKFNLLSEDKFKIDSEIDKVNVPGKVFQFERINNTLNGSYRKIEQIINYSNSEIEQIEYVSTNHFKRGIGTIHFKDKTIYTGMLDSEQKPYLFGIWTSPDGTKTFKLNQGYLYNEDAWCETNYTLQKLLDWLKKRTDEGYLEAEELTYLFLYPITSDFNINKIKADISKENEKSLKEILIKPTNENGFLNNFSISFDKFSLDMDQVKFNLYLVENGDKTIYQSINFNQLKDLATIANDYWAKEKNILVDFEIFQKNFMNNSSRNGVKYFTFIYEEHIKNLLSNYGLTTANELFLNGVTNFNNLELFFKGKNGLELSRLKFGYKFLSDRSDRYENFKTHDDFLKAVDNSKRWKNRALLIYLEDINEEKIYKLFSVSNFSVESMENLIFGK